MVKANSNRNEIMYLEIEKSRINREKARVVLDKSLLLYFSFLVVGVIGFVNKYFDATMLTVVIVIGTSVLIIGTIPYLFITHTEERKIKAFLEELKNAK